MDMMGGDRRRRVARWVSAIGLVVLALMLVHPRFEIKDQRLLLTLNGEPFDVVGGVAELWGRFASDCGSVGGAENGSSLGRAAQALLEKHSPPDSQSARVVRVDRLSDWLLVEAAFDDMPPVLVLMRVAVGDNESLMIKAVWSGTTHPWRIVPFAAEFLKARAPEVPAALLRCAKPGFR